MEGLSRSTIPPPVQPVMTLSVRPDLPLSLTKPVRATNWLMPRFEPIAPPTRVKNTGQQCPYSACSLRPGGRSGQSIASLVLCALVSSLRVVCQARFDWDLRDLGRGRAATLPYGLYRMLSHPRIKSLFFTHERPEGLHDVGARACEKAKEGTGYGAHHQEGTTDGECSTHTPPYPCFPWKRFFPPHMPVQWVLISVGRTPLIKFGSKFPLDHASGCALR